MNNGSIICFNIITLKLGTHTQSAEEKKNSSIDKRYIAMNKICIQTCYMYALFQSKKYETIEGKNRKGGKG